MSICLQFTGGRSPLFEVRRSMYLPTAVIFLDGPDSGSLSQWPKRLGQGDKKKNRDFHFLSPYEVSCG